MKRVSVFIAAVAFFSILSAGSVKAECISCTTIFTDNFESYDVGTFPAGWELYYIGNGITSQIVDDAYAVSGTKSLRLVGNNGYAAQANSGILWSTVPSRVVYEGNILIQEPFSCKFTGVVAHMGLFKQEGVDTVYGMILFKCDGKIYASRRYAERSQDVLLAPFSANTWYHVTVDMDLVSRVYDVYIDGIRRASGLQIVDSGQPYQIELTSGHSAGTGLPMVWFDDITVSQPCSVQ